MTLDDRRTAIAGGWSCAPPGQTRTPSSDDGSRRAWTERASGGGVGKGVKPGTFSLNAACDAPLRRLSLPLSSTYPLDVFLSTHPSAVDVPRFPSTLPLDGDSPPPAPSPCFGVPRSVPPPCRRDRRSSVAPIAPSGASLRDPSAGRIA